MPTVPKPKVIVFVFESVVDPTDKWYWNCSALTFPTRYLSKASLYRQAKQAARNSLYLTGRWKVKVRTPKARTYVRFNIALQGKYVRQPDE